MRRNFWNPSILRPYFLTVFSKVWAVISEWRNIFFKKYFGSNHYIWLELQLVRCPWKSDNLKCTLLWSSPSNMGKWTAMWDLFAYLVRKLHWYWGRNIFWMNFCIFTLNLCNFTIFQRCILKNSSSSSKKKLKEIKWSSIDDCLKNVRF